MSRVPFVGVLSLVVFLSGTQAWGESDQTRVAMLEKSAATFYVQGAIDGYGPVELMVDTGSGYTTINEQTLAVLMRQSSAHYLREVRGVLADGSELDVPIYSVGRMRIGDRCWLSDVEVAVFPGTSRQILGLSALRKVAPFVFSVEPPGLMLSGCQLSSEDGGGGAQVLTSVVSTRLN